MTISYGATITIQRRAEQDPYGDGAGGGGAWVNHHTISGVTIWWQMAPKGSHPSDPADDRRSIDITPVEISLPAGSDALDTDRIILPDGNYYRVRQMPQIWESPWSGWQPGIVLLLRGVLD